MSPDSDSGRLDQRVMPVGVQPISTPSENPNRSRLSIVETIYHQSPGDNPVAIGTNVMRWLDSDEQPYIRKLTLTTEWKLVDLGWLQEVGIGMLIIQNDEKPPTARKPCPKNFYDYICGVVEVLSLESEYTIQITNECKAQWLILPGESMRGLPLSKVWLRANKGTAKVTINIIPK